MDSTGVEISMHAPFSSCHISLHIALIENLEFNTVFSYSHLVLAILGINVPALRSSDIIKARALNGFCEPFQFTERSLSTGKHIRLVLSCDLVLVLLVMLAD